ncbi:MAG: hypothetical protein KAR42_05255 [candidate division Zixibacteria bacterium]|nr:hypothetical protein [candidate division Zixibacteria bacterium]
MKTWVPRKKQIIPIQPTSNINKDHPVPEIVTKWLAKLHLLYGVPFEYLVPDVRMLPMDSIKFFHVDENWMNNLIDGALSVGRINQHDLQHDQGMQNALHRESGKEMRNIRKRLLKQAETNEAAPEVRAGFILRSEIVEGWPGLEVKAYAMDDEKNMLTLLRMERLAKDVMICIFDGEFKRVELRQPAEAMHFGLDIEKGQFSKSLRSTGVSRPLGTILDVELDAIPFRTADRRTVNIEKLVEDMKTKLGKVGELGDYFTSAEFAVVMVESAQEGVFHNEY